MMKMIYILESFFLTKPFEEYEKVQIDLVEDFSWLDITKLEGFEGEVREILKSNKLLSEDRIEKIVREVEKRIQYIKNLIDLKNK